MKLFAMKMLLNKYAAYNHWANKKITDMVGLLNEEQVNREIISSFPAVRPTLAHLWDAESIWWQRIKLSEKITVPGEAFAGSITEMGNCLLEQSLLWSEMVQKATEAALKHEFIYRNSKKEQFKQPVCEVLIHLFNHQSYHRGQLITMFRQLGIEEIHGMDFISFSRKK